MPATEPAEQVHVRPFADWLREQSQGLTHDALGDELHDLIAAVVSTGKPGKLALEILVKPADTHVSTVTVTYRIKVTRPEGERGSSIFFVDPAGNLTRHNPQQQRLPLAQVPNNVDPDTGEIEGAQDA
jgi:hypothetical protein